MLKLERKSKTVSIGEIYEWKEARKLNLDPVYQRKSVWTQEQRSFLIDTILRNYPIPPIFLRIKLDTKTGRAVYDVIDGKQRLTSLFEFIAGEISSVNVDETNDSLTGVFFEDLSTILPNLLSQFWSYEIPVEYIATDDDDTITKVFDRLNRNGERLNGQELRNSKYFSSKLLNFVRTKCSDPRWSAITKNLQIHRMEDHELLSELFFLVAEDRILDSSDKGRIDSFYEKYQQFEDELYEKFNLIEEVFFKLHPEGLLPNLGVSHIYGLWSLSFYCWKYLVKMDDFDQKLTAFFSDISTRKNQNENTRLYRTSMDSNTRALSQRKRRLAALLKAVNIEPNEFVKI